MWHLISYVDISRPWVLKLLVKRYSECICEMFLNEINILISRLIWIVTFESEERRLPSPLLVGLIQSTEALHNQEDGVSGFILSARLWAGTTGFSCIQIKTRTSTYTICFPGFPACQLQEDFSSLHNLMSFSAELRVTQSVNIYWGS